MLRVFLIFCIQDLTNSDTVITCYAGLKITVKGGGIYMKVRPLYDRILVRRLSSEEKTKGGIIIPETAKEKPVEAEVIAVGRGRRNEEGNKRVEMDVKVGDRILFAKYTGNEIKIDGEEHLILNESDVLAIIER
jgi:chaperonin GroES